TILILLGFAFLFSFNLAKANLVINEIMYDLPGSDTANNKSREWVEIYNPDSSDVNIDATKWRFYDGSGNRTINNEANFSILSGAYVIFAGDKATFLLDHSNFSGVVYDTGITSLNNTGATLKILDQNGTLVDSVTYTSSLGGVGDGNSLQLVSGIWKSVIPTPGTQNYVSSNITTYNNNLLIQDTTETKTKIVEIPKIKTKITAKALVFVGIPVEFKANVTGYSNESLSYGNYFWNFGDGDSKETRVNDTAKFAHTFSYEGEYTVALEYYQNYYSDNPDASDKIIIKVVSADISISKVGDEKDFFIEISNNTNYDADLSKWSLSSSAKSFILPKNMILEPKKKIILSPKITGFSISDKDTLKLMNPQWETVFDYSSSIQPIKILTKNSTPVKISKLNTDRNNIVVASEYDTKTEIPVNSLEATAVKSDADTGNNLMYGFGLFAFLGISASATYFIRSRNRKTVLRATGSDFEIMDE
ncbi:MAG: lamin tail domain-containing protein, partial [Patescibacteria group bacterium]